MTFLRGETNSGELHILAFAGLTPAPATNFPVSVLTDPSKCEYGGEAQESTTNRRESNRRTLAAGIQFAALDIDRTAANVATGGRISFHSLSQTQCSTGTTQSRPSPARAGKIKESAGQTYAIRNAARHSESGQSEVPPVVQATCRNQFASGRAAETRKRSDSLSTGPAAVWESRTKPARNLILGVGHVPCIGGSNPSTPTNFPHRPPTEHSHCGSARTDSPRRTCPRRTCVPTSALTGRWGYFRNNTP